MSRNIFLLLCLISSFCDISNATPSTVANQIQFITDTFVTNTYYRAAVFPRLDQTHGIPVAMKFSLASIKDFDEVAGTLELIGELTITWTDEIINDQFVLATHNNLSNILFTSKNVWKPSVTTFNSVSNIIEVGEISNKVRVTMDTGGMEWGPGIVTKTGCSVDVSNFPFDKQECDVVFTNWGYIASEVYFTESETEIDLEGYRENEQWSIDTTSAEIKTIDNISYMYFKITLIRRSLFFLTNLVFPILVLSLLNAIVFLLPPATGERISYTITAFMSFAVYLTLTADNLPRTSEPMSILCVYLMVMTVISAGTALFTIVTLRIFHTDEETRVPDKLAWIVGCLNCRICKDDDDDDDMEMFTVKTPEPDMKQVPADMVEGSGGNEKAPLPDDEEVNPDDDEDDTKEKGEAVKGKFGVDFKLLAATLDFMFFLVFVGLNVLVTFVFLVPLAAAMNS